jgi:adenine C2-methylase RlmN of 23S rRNA A2503 and tRNA A37
MKFIKSYESNEGYYSKKYIFLDEGRSIEAVFIDKPDKNILCLSCMYGCPVGCAFCKSGETYFGKVSYRGMKDMIEFIVKDQHLVKCQKKILFSFMGSGDIMLNYLEVAKCINYLASSYKNLSISISVSGAAIENLSFLSKKLDYLPKLQFSFHSPFDKERKKIIPATRSLSKIFEELKLYRERSGGNITLNYVLLEDVNDSQEHVRGIVGLIKEFGFNLKINGYHKVNDIYSESSKKEKFIKELIGEGISPEIYFTDGVDIGAACGQLMSTKG